MEATEIIGVCDRTVRGIPESFQTRGLFCGLYNDGGSYFFVTVKARDRVDKHRLA